MNLDPRLRFGALFIWMLASGVSAWAQSVQTAECIGNPRDPVKAVYLHGMFPDTDSPRDGGLKNWLALEVNNRQKLRVLARELGIRIAVPIAPFKKEKEPKGVRYWTSKIEAGNPTATEQQVQNSARQACGGTEPQSPAALIGFSNGANLARLMCTKGSSFSRVVAIGYENKEVDPSACAGKIDNIDDHSYFEKGDLSILKHELNGLKQQHANLESDTAT